METSYYFNYDKQQLRSSLLFCKAYVIALFEIIYTLFLFLVFTISERQSKARKGILEENSYFLGNETSTGPS